MFFNLKSNFQENAAQEVYLNVNILTSQRDYEETIKLCLILWLDFVTNRLDCGTVTMILSLSVLFNVFYYFS